MRSLEGDIHRQLSGLTGPDVSRRKLLEIGGGLALTTAGFGASSPALAQSGSTADRSLSVLHINVAVSLDRDSSQASTPGISEATLNCLDPLVGFKVVPQGDVTLRDLTNLPQSLQPRLAESWEKIGDRHWRFKLRQGVTNHLGHEFTADDVIYTIARAKSVSGQVTAAAYVAITGGLFPAKVTSKDATQADRQLAGEVVAIDKYTVEFNLVAETGLFPTIFAVWNQYIFDSAEMKAHATADDPWSHGWCNAGNIIGFGPYYLDKLVPGTSATLKANPHYYGGAPGFATVAITASSNPSAQLAAVQTGSVDFAEGVGSQSMKALEGSGTVRVVGGYTNKIIELFINYMYAPWDGPKNKLLRQAVAYAMPYDLIINGVYPGIARRSLSHVPSTFGGYVATQTYATNVAKAKELMAEAGYPSGKGLDAAMPGLQLHYGNDQQDLATLAVFIRSALNAIGLPITLQPIPPAVFSSRKLQKKDLPMVLDPSDNPLIPDALYLVQTFYVPPEAGGLINEGNYNNETVNRLTAEGFKQAGAARDAIAGQIQTILMDELPAIPIAEVKAVAVAKKTINGYMPTDNQNVTQFQYLT